MKPMQIIESCVTTCFGDRFGPQDLSTPIAELGVDSLDLVEFVMAVEEEAAVEIEADRIDQARGLDQFAEIIGAGQGAAR